MTRNLTVVGHPLIQHKLTLMRDKDTPSAVFRQLLREISLLPAYEVLRGLPTATKAIEKPLGPMDAPILKGKKLVFASILRAGNGLLDGMLDLAPSARVGRTGRAARHCRRSDAGDGQLGFGGTRQAQGRRRRGHQVHAPTSPRQSAMARIRCPPDRAPRSLFSRRTPRR